MSANDEELGTEESFRKIREADPRIPDKEVQKEGLDTILEGLGVAVSDTERLDDIITLTLNHYSEYFLTCLGNLVKLREIAVRYGLPRWQIVGLEEVMDDLAGLSRLCEGEVTIPEKTEDDDS